MNPLHTTIEEFAAEAIPRRVLLPALSHDAASPQNISCPSNCRRIDADIGELRQRRRSPCRLPWPLLLAWCLGILLAWWCVALRGVAGLWLLAMDSRLDLLDLRRASLISMGSRSLSSHRESECSLAAMQTY